MTEKKLPSQKIVLGSTKGKLVRFSHLHVHEARENRESGKTEFSVVALIPKGNTEDVKAVQEAIERFKQEVWIKEGKKVPPQFWSPLKNGDTDTKQDGSPLGAECKGHYVLNVKTGEESPPNVVGTTKDGNGKFLPIGKGQVKSGDWGRISLNLKPYIKGTGGVGAYLSSVQLVQEGEPLGSRSSAEDDFAAFEDEEDDALLA